MINRFGMADSGNFYFLHCTFICFLLPCETLFAYFVCALLSVSVEILPVNDENEWRTNNVDCTGLVLPLLLLPTMASTSDVVSTTEHNIQYKHRPEKLLVALSHRRSTPPSSFLLSCQPPHCTDHRQRICLWMHHHPLSTTQRGCHSHFWVNPTNGGRKAPLLSFCSVCI